MPLAGRLVVQSVSVLLIVGLAALAALVGMTIWLNEQSREHFEQVIAARDVRSAAVELRSAVQSAESSERGYLLTNNEIYLSPYGTSKTLALRQLDLLKLRAEGAAVPPVIPRLSDAVRLKFADMDRIIALKQARNDADAQAAIRSNRGKLLMDEINLFASGIVRAADEQLTAAVTRQRENTTWLRVASLAAALLVVLVVGAALTAVYRYTRELAAARDHASALNAALENRVLARTEQLSRANEEIKRFAHIVSHDLRAPLVNIVGFAGEIEQSLAQLRPLIETASANDNAADQARQAAEVDMPEALSFIRSSTTKMDALIGALLKISREGQRRLQPQEIRLRPLIDETLAAIQHQLAEAEGRCTVDLEVETIVSDRLSLEQILGNLLDNAVKYGDQSRPVRIEIRTRYAGGGRMRMEIADNGRGIAEGDLGRVFELFRRVGPQTKRGDGIGLAYVQTLVRNLSGEIAVTSRLGSGSMFSVVLPLDLRSADIGKTA